MSYPKSEATVRPYRLWDPDAKGDNGSNGAPLRWRYYSDPKRAHMGALIEVRWSKVGKTIEVYNANTQDLLGQYTRKVNTIQFLGRDK